MEKERLDRMWDLLDSYQTPRVSDDFTWSVLRRIRVQQAPTRMEENASDTPRWRVAWRFVAGLAASLLVALTLGILWRHSLEREARRTVSPPPDEAARPLTDDDIIRNLEIYENIDLLQNLDLLADLEVVENLDKSSVQRNTTEHEN
ncbi:MAG: hypothetical protein AB1696_20140 [Planctomycetota bacterium]